MEKIILEAQKRVIFGKKNKKLRKEGLIPAVLYGRKISPIPLSVGLKKFQDVYKKAGDTDIIDLIIKDEDKNEETKKVLIYEAANHFLSGQPIHVDFYEVEMDKSITAHIPLTFFGESPAVKAGGVLVKAMNEIEVECLPADLPHEIKIDISELKEFNQTFYVKDLPALKRVKYLIDINTPVVTVNEPLTEEELEAELGKTKTVEEIKVETEEKKEEREDKEVVSPEDKSQEKPE
ncbi:MAG: 50S ribosomal protein L25 [Candidatus Paceibacterota bacterium]|jgi:large subunit ribosomal protein L25|nr:50S ribosomal protein L25 [Candidatus Paceibacterota bacterium]MDD3548356.1 50S ribosomal protein L25 [Candidatus Paceibacterota bacterium]MDD4998884.1 50S ribosomal protein L25 [Candidatus Paceibacterota bacterium]MDD5545117.1 50S ribosomal protein L25 [Candidatus Paceibacterota bacterium]